MKKEWIGSLALLSFAVTVGFIGASLALSAQGPPPGKGGGGGGGDGGGESVCSVVENPPVWKKFNPANAPFLGQDFGRPLAVAELDTGSFLVASSSSDNTVIVFFRFDSSTGDIVYEPSASIDIGDITGIGLGEVRRLALGDIDGDGIPDVVAGDDLNGDGAVHVFLSDDASLGYPVDTPLLRPAGAQRFGAAVLVGDGNADGQIDVVVGAPTQAAGSKSGPGHVYLFEFDWTTSTFSLVETLSTGEDGDTFGVGVNVAEVTGDGVVDLIVGAPFKDGGKRTKDAGVTFVYYDASDRTQFHRIVGKKGEGLRSRATGDMIVAGSPTMTDILAVNALSASTRRGLVIEGPITGDRDAANGFELPIDSNIDGGYGVSDVGALDRGGDDALADIVIGAPDAFDSNGAVYVYLSQNDVPASNCLILRSPDGAGLDFGWTVASISDSSYFLVGEPITDQNNDGTLDGQIYVFDVRDLPWPP